MSSPDNPSVVKEIEVSADGGFRGPGSFNKFVERDEAALADDFRQALTSFFRKQQGHRFRSFLYLSQAVYPYFDRFQSFSFKSRCEE